jgi:hypothetical protein
MATEEIMDSSLNILESIRYDNSIESWQYIGYTPQNQANINTRSSPIQIDITASDSYINVSKSFLVIKGELVRNDSNNPYIANDDIALINNAMMYLFTEITFTLGGDVVERISSPGQITSMLGYLSLPDDYSTSSGLKSCWSKDSTNHANSVKFTASANAPIAGYIPTENPNYNQGFAVRKGLLMSADPRGSFSFIIPFDHIFGFGDYNKVIYNVKHSLLLTRNSSDNPAIYHANGVADGKINLAEITWKVPHIKPDTVKLMELRGIIESKQTIPIAFPSRTSDAISVPQTQNFTWRVGVTNGIEKPRWIIVAFQTNRTATQEQNPAVFDHLNVTNACVTLNGEKYPLHDFVTNFARNDYSELYEKFDDFKKEYYGFNSLVGGTQVNYPAFKSLFPIIVFDVRRQSERLRSGVIDMQLKFTFANAVPAETTAYSLIISDKLYKLASNGERLTLVTV